MSEQAVMNEEVALMEADEQRADLVNGLQALKGKIRGRDMMLLGVKVNRDVYTVRAYLKGDVRDEALALQILKYANGFIALNNNCDFQKSQLKY